MIETATAEDQLVVEMQIGATPERVFEALTSADDVVAWWGADGKYRTERYTADLRVGGAWRAEGTGSDGEPFHVCGEFVEVARPHTLAYTWEPSWGGCEAPPTTTVRIELSVDGDGTRLVLTHSGFAGHAAAREAHSQGWPLVLGWLREHLARS